jgi:hypothetical protein
MDLIEAMSKLRREADELSLHRNELAHNLSVVDRQLADVAANLRSLQDVAVHFGLIPEPKAEIRPRDWLGYKRQQAVKAALVEINRPVHLRDIVKFLTAKGRSDDTVDLVSAALSALRNKGVAEPRGSGVWALVGTNDTPPGLQEIFGQSEVG